MFRTSSAFVEIVLKKKYFVDSTVPRNYDFDSGVVNSTLVNNIISPPQQGFGQPQHHQAGTYIPQQPYGGGGAPVNDVHKAKQAEVKHIS